jgi:hypothetical protein
MEPVSVLSASVGVFDVALLEEADPRPASDGRPDLPRS